MLAVRRASAADLDTIESLMAIAIDTLQRDVLTPGQIEASRAVMGLDRQLIADGTYMMAERDGVIVGCGGWSYRATLYGGDHSAPLRDARLLDPAHDAARIRAMYTHPAHVRTGVASAILDACEQAAVAAGFRELQLMATLSGEPLYARRGYRPIERVDTIVGTTIVPLIRMTKPAATCVR